MDSKKRKKKDVGIVLLCVAFIIGKRECCSFIRKRKRQPQETNLLVFRSTVSLEKMKGRSSLESSRILVPFLT